MSVSVSEDVCGEDCNVSNKAQLVPHESVCLPCVCCLSGRTVIGKGRQNGRIRFHSAA